MSADLVIRGGTVVDGTGAPGRRADVAVTDGMISEIGDGLDGRRELDASGQIVTPGFIDIHSHYDAQVFWDPALTPSSFHGVTSVVAGNCGFSIAPCRPEHRALLARTLQHVEDMNLATLEAGIPWDFETFPEYLDSVARHGTALNYGVYVGHTAVRLFVMGEEGYEREQPTDDELADDAGGRARGDGGRRDGLRDQLVGDAQRRRRPAGAEPARRPRRARSAARAAARPRQGRRRAAPGRADQARRRPRDPAARLGRPLTWTALLTIKGFPWHEDIIKDNDAARADGGQVWPQVSVRPLVFQMNLREPFTFNMAPAFAELMAEPDAVRLERYADPAWREQAHRGPRTTRRSSARTGTRSRWPRAPRTPS